MQVKDLVKYCTNDDVVPDNGEDLKIERLRRPRDNFNKKFSKSSHIERRSQKTAERLLY